MLISSQFRLIKGRKEQENWGICKEQSFFCHWQLEFKYEAFL